MVSYTRARKVVDRQLKKLGKIDADQALIVRGGVTRKCRAARLEYNPREKGLHEEGASRILVSALSLEEFGSEAPNHKLDKIFFAGAEYNIVEPIKGPRQSDPTIFFYDCAVTYNQTVNYLRPVELIGAIALGVGFDSEVADIAIVNEIHGASFGFGFGMVPIARAVYELQASFDLGFIIESPVTEIKYIGPVAFGLGFDAAAIIENTQYIAADFSLGFNAAAIVRAMSTEFISASFGLGFSMASVVENTQYVPAVNFGLGFAIDNAIVTSIPSGPVDSGDATASIDDTTPVEGQTITCTFNDDDPDGPATGITYQWRNHTDSVDISGATSAAYTVEHSLVGKALRCRVSYTDGEGFSETIETASTAAVSANLQVATIVQSAVNSGTTGGSLASASFNVAAGSYVAVLTMVVGTGATVSNVTNNKGLTVLAVDVNATTWNQTVTKNCVIDFRIIFVPTAQTGMTVTATLGGTKQRSFIGAYEISGGHAAVWGVSASPQSFIRSSRTMSANGASAVSWGLSTVNSETTSSRWVWMGGAVAVGEAAENDDFNTAALGPNAATVLTNGSTAVPGMQYLVAQRQSASTAAETMAITATGGNAFRELNGLGFEIRATPP